jgi:hypothetical protein
MRRCSFYDNEKTTGSGGAVALGGYSNVLIEDCWFENNRSIGSPRSGGAVGTAGVTSEIEMRGCTFIRNYTIGAGAGGAVRADGANVLIESCTFSENAQEFDLSLGGAAVALEADNNTFVRNVVTRSAGDQAVSLWNGTLTTSCNVYWDNPLGHTSGFALDASDLVADPLFCAPEAGNLTVNVLSPCLPENNLSCDELIGAWGEGCGSVSVEPSSWGRIKNAYREDPEDETP